MKIVRITGVLSLILLFSFVRPESKRSGENYHLKIEEAHFEITFPVSKTYIKDLTGVQIVDGKEVKSYNYVAVMQGTSDENLSYQVVAHKISDIHTNDDIERLFDVSRDRVIGDLRTKIDSVTTVTIENEEQIELDGIQGRSWSARIKHPEMIKDIVLYNKFFFTRDFIYKVSIMHRNSNFPNKSGAKFFDSFKVLE